MDTDNPNFAVPYIAPGEIIGEYCHGSLRGQDILDAMRDTIDAVRGAMDVPVRAEFPSGPWRKTDATGEAIDAMIADTDPDDVEGVIAAMDALDAWVSDLTWGACYFGSTEGDGSCFGIWRHDGERA